MLEVGGRVRSLRLALGLSQESFARRSGLLRVEVSNIERGRNQASSSRVRVALARGFGLPLTELNDLIAGSISVSQALRMISVLQPKGAA